MTSAYILVVLYSHFLRSELLQQETEGRRASEMSFLSCLSKFIFFYSSLVFIVSNAFRKACVFIYLIKHKMPNTRASAKSANEEIMIISYFSFSLPFFAVLYGRKPAHQLVINFTIEKRNKIKNK